MDMTSPLLSLPGAVAADGVDAGVAAHYGSFNVEQRHLAEGDGFVDLSDRDVLRISGPDRLSWLHNLTTQFFEGLEPDVPVGALVLSPQGHVEHAFRGVDDGEAFTLHTEPGRGAELAAWLDSMRFMSRVEVEDVSADKAVCWRPVVEPGGAADSGTGRAGKFDVLDRDQLEAYARAAGPAAGLWAYDALRIARGEPRLGFDTDERTIPNEVGWVPAEPSPGPATDAPVHLDKGCYRGQETVARVHNLGRPPRRLTLLHLDGSQNALPEAGAPLRMGDREVGFVGSSARHYELGPIALGLVKRNVPLDAQLAAGDLVVAQEVVVDPEVGLHVRPMRER